MSVRLSRIIFALDMLFDIAESAHSWLSSVLLDLLAFCSSFASFSALVDASLEDGLLSQIKLWITSNSQIQVIDYFSPFV